MTSALEKNRELLFLWLIVVSILTLIDVNEYMMDCFCQPCPGVQWELPTRCCPICGMPNWKDWLEVLLYFAFIPFNRATISFVEYMLRISPNVFTRIILPVAGNASYWYLLLSQLLKFIQRMRSFKRSSPSDLRAPFPSHDYESSE